MSAGIDDAALALELARTSLVFSAKPSGRWLEVVTYMEGGTHPIKASLLFRRAEDATECARILSAAQRDGHDASIRSAIETERARYAALVTAARRMHGSEIAAALRAIDAAGERS